MYQLSFILRLARFFLPCIAENFRHLYRYICIPLQSVLWSRSRRKGAGLLLCDLGVLRWQRCGNQIITIVTLIERTNRYRYTFRKVQLSPFIFQN